MQHLKNMVKNYSTFTTAIVIENDGIKASVIDVMIARFPRVVTDIFKELDNKTLTTCRNASRLCCDYLDSEKILWVRIIQSYKIHNMKITYQQWKKVLKNTPVEYVKELSVCTQQFFNFTSQGFSLRSRYQWYPLQIVAEQGNLELYKYLFEKTKNTSLEIAYKWTGLHMAATKGQEEICKFIIENSDEKNPSDENGTTQLHFAAEKGLTDVCKLIIEHIDNKNPAALNGCTPLHLAAKEGHMEIVRLIVETGVDKNTLFNGETPLDMARPFKSFTFYKLLSNDKFELRGMILTDLLLCFLMYFLLFGCLFLVMSLFFFIYDVWNCDFDCLKNIDWNLGILVTSVIAFFLTIMIRVWLCFQ